MRRKGVRRNGEEFTIRLEGRRDNGGDRGGVEGGRRRRRASIEMIRANRTK